MFLNRFQFFCFHSSCYCAKKWAQVLQFMLFTDCLSVRLPVSFCYWNKKMLQQQTSTSFRASTYLIVFITSIITFSVWYCLFVLFLLPLLHSLLPINSLVLFFHSWSSYTFSKWGFSGWDEFGSLLFCCSYWLARFLFDIIVG